MNIRIPLVYDDPNGQRCTEFEEITDAVPVVVAPHLSATFAVHRGLGSFTDYFVVTEVSSGMNVPGVYGDTAAAAVEHATKRLAGVTEEHSQAVIAKAHALLAEHAAKQNPVPA